MIVIEMSVSILEVVEIAKHFAVVASWGYFKLISVNEDPDNSDIYIVTADLGAFQEKNMKFTISESEREVIAYGPEESRDNKELS